MLAENYLKKILNPVRVLFFLVKKKTRVILKQYRVIKIKQPPST